ncbi:MAG: hypothetical protein AAB676_13030, partial [Verrucomicrobiota bacterium]
TACPVWVGGDGAIRSLSTFLLESTLALFQVNPEPDQMFDFYVLKNWPVTKVTRVLGVNVGPNAFINRVHKSP